MMPLASSAHAGAIVDIIVDAVIGELVGAGVAIMLTISQLKNREFALCFDGQIHHSHGCRWSRNQCPKLLKSDKTNSTLSMSSWSGVTPEVKVSC